MEEGAMEEEATEDGSMEDGGMGEGGAGAMFFVCSYLSEVPSTIP